MYSLRDGAEGSKKTRGGQGIVPQAIGGGRVVDFQSEEVAQADGEASSEAQSFAVPEA